MRSTRARRRQACFLTAAMAAALAAAAGGCAEAPASAQSRPVHSPSALRASEGLAAGRTAPIPLSVVRRLGKGYLYLLAGPDATDTNLWLISDGTEHQLTFGAPNSAVSSFGAAPAGIVLSDDQFGADDLAQLTTRGLRWLPNGKSSDLHQASSATMTASGKILYITPPDALGYPDSKNFALRGQNTFSGRSRIIYRSTGPLSDPAPGPQGQIALIRQPSAADDKSTTVVVISGHGRPRTVRTGYKFPDALTWSANAPDLIVATWPLRAEAISTSGARTALPGGWFPITWTPAGTRLIVISTSRIGYWSPKHPHAITAIGPLERGQEVSLATWLDRAAALDASQR